MKGDAVDRVPVSQQVAGRGVPGTGLDNLLGRPLSRRMLGDIEMHDVAIDVSRIETTRGMIGDLITRDERVTGTRIAQE